MVTFADVSQWQEINCKLTSKKSPLGFFDDLSGFLLPCPDNVPVHKEEEPEPELCVAVSDNQGDLFDMLHEAKTQESNNQVKATRNTKTEGAYGMSWPETAKVPGGSEWAPGDTTSTSTVPGAPAQHESVQERAERIIRDHPGDDVIDVEVIDVEIVEDETPSDTLIDAPISQELAIATPAVPVKAKKPSGYTDDFENFWRTYPRRIEKKSAFKAWKTALKSGATADEITAGAARYAKYRAGEPERFTKHPSTWLNRGCWEEEYSTAGIGYGYNGGNGTGLVARNAEEAEYLRQLDNSCSEMFYRSLGFNTAEEYVEYQRGIAELNAREAEAAYAEAAAQRIAF